MKLGYTVHSILGKKFKEIPPKVVHPFEDSTYELFLKNGVIREPTDDELSLYNIANGSSAKTAKPAKEPAKKSTADKPARASKKKAAEPAPEPEAAPETDGEPATAKTNDPDEVDPPADTSNSLIG